MVRGVKKLSFCDPVDLDFMVRIGGGDTNKIYKRVRGRKLRKRKRKYNREM